MFNGVGFALLILCMYGLLPSIHLNFGIFIQLLVFVVRTSVKREGANYFVCSIIMITFL